MKKVIILEGEDAGYENISNSKIDGCRDPATEYRILFQIIQIGVLMYGLDSSIDNECARSVTKSIPHFE